MKPLPTTSIVKAAPVDAGSGTSVVIEGTALTTLKSSVFDRPPPVLLFFTQIWWVPPTERRSGGRIAVIVVGVMSSRDSSRCVSQNGALSGTNPVPVIVTWRPGAGRSAPEAPL